MEYLSDIELYFLQSAENQSEIKLTGDEFHHASKVMRHRAGDKIYFTNGQGSIFLAEIIAGSSNSFTLSLLNEFKYENRFKRIHLCLPLLKNQDRFEFAIEKSVELGITSFICFVSERTVSRSKKIERWNKIAFAAMKQSLRSFAPQFQFFESVELISKLEGEKIILEQKANKNLNEIRLNPDINYYFIFGPEGGFSENELKLFNENESYSLTTNRLRTETAAVFCASIISSKILSQ